jgi:transposase-like protein
MADPIDYADEVAWLLTSGESTQRIAQRLGLKPGSLARSLYRHGHPDLARPFGAWEKRERSAA